MSVDSVGLRGQNPQIDPNLKTEAPKVEFFDEKGELLPDTAKKVDDFLRQITEGPALPEPKPGAMSFENLVQFLLNGQRELGIKNKITDIRAKNDELQEAYKKEIAEFKKEIEKMEQKRVAKGFLKAFQIIGAVFGAIASVAIGVVGGLTGNPGLIAAGVMGTLSAIDGITSLASDGKYSLSVGFTELGKEMGFNDKNAAIFSNVVMGIGIAVTLAVSIYGAWTASGTKVAAEIAEKCSKHATALVNMAKIGAYSGVAQGIATTGTASANIAATVFQSDIEKIKADTLDIEAVLEEIRQTRKMLQKFLENEMETSKEVVDKVKSIVDDCNSTAATVMTAAPQMA